MAVVIIVIPVVIALSVASGVMYKLWKKHHPETRPPSYTRRWNNNNF